MVTANFEHDGNTGVLYLKTHFGHKKAIECEKSDDEIFRLGGTAANEIVEHEGVVLKLTDDSPTTKFRAFTAPEAHFDAEGVLSDEQWSDADLHCYVTEYYPLDMEGKAHEWFISKLPIKDAQYLFINLDVLDGGGNLVRRYRVSPFTGKYKCLT